jgi:hypothetical protein
MKTETIVEILEILGSEYSKRWTPEEKKQKIKTWAAMLTEITDEQGKIALRKALEDNSEFMPPVGKFKQMCLSGVGCHSLEDEAEHAWSLVINNLNSWSSPVFKDSAIAETIRKMGGWAILCSITNKEVPFRKQDFLALYPALKRRKQEFFPLLNEGSAKNLYVNGQAYPNLKFIGYEESDDLKEVVAQIEANRNSENKLLEMIKTRT